MLATHHAYPDVFAPGIFANPRSLNGSFGSSQFRLFDQPAPARVRFEMLGDLIVDCGHNPLRSEIHPPVAALLHASSGDSAMKRYTLFAWSRNGQGDGAAFDLWPPAPRSAAETSSGTPRMSSPAAYPLGGATCTAVPEGAPTHFRCNFAAGADDGGRIQCAHNERMRSDCATAVAGGVVDVTW